MSAEQVDMAAKLRDAMTACLEDRDGRYYATHAGCTCKGNSQMTEAVIGKFYSVPAVRVKGWHAFDGWCPVIGPKHSDAEIVKFPWPHWHLDWRFVPAKAYANVAHLRDPSRIYGYPIQCPDARGNIVVQEGPIDKRMKCKRALPPYVVPPATWKENWIAELRNAFCGSKLVNGVCPHRGIPVSAFIREGDVLTCPGHGLRFNATTGLALQRETAK